MATAAQPQLEPPLEPAAAKAAPCAAFRHALRRLGPMPSSGGTSSRCGNDDVTDFVNITIYNGAGFRCRGRLDCEPKKKKTTSPQKNHISFMPPTHCPLVMANGVCKDIARALQYAGGF